MADAPKAKPTSLSPPGPASGPPSPAQGKSLVAFSKTIKNAEVALNPENKFNKIGKLGPFTVMSKVTKNWEEAKNPENKFKTVAKFGPITAMAKIERNAEKLKQEDGWRQILGPPKPHMLKQEGMNIPMVEMTSMGKSRERSQSFNDTQRKGSQEFLSLEENETVKKRRYSTGSLPGSGLLPPIKK